MTKKWEKGNPKVESRARGKLKLKNKQTSFLPNESSFMVLMT